MDLSVQAALNHGFLLGCGPQGLVAGALDPFETKSPHGDPQNSLALVPESFFSPLKSYRLRRLSVQDFLRGDDSTLKVNLRLDRVGYEQRFAQAQAQMDTGQLRKVVIPLRVEVSPVPPLLHLLHAVTRSERLQPFGWWKGDAYWVGATPETLLSWTQGELRIDALAGTVPIDQGSQLLTDPKLIEEQTLVVDDILARLAHLAPWSVTAPEVLHHPPLAHRYQRLSVKTHKQVSWRELNGWIQALHPTAAIGGKPQDEALALVREWAQMESRGLYGAPIGFFAGDWAHVLVGLRGIERRGDRAWIWVGGGVTAKSHLEEEWQELQLKIRATLQGLGLE